MCGEYKLDASTGAVSCYSASMVKLIWFADDKFLKFYSCSHKNVQSGRIYVSMEIVGLSTCSSKRVHQHTELA